MFIDEDKHLISSIVPVNYSGDFIEQKINANKATSEPYADKKSICKELVLDGYSMLEYNLESNFIFGKEFYDDFKRASITTDGFNIYTFYKSGKKDSFNDVDDDIKDINNTLKNNDNANFSVLSVIDYYLLINKKECLYELGYNKADYIYITADMLADIQKTFFTKDDRNFIDIIDIGYYSTETVNYEFIKNACNVLLSYDWKGFLLFMKHIKSNNISSISTQAQSVWSQVQQPITPNGGMLNSFVATQAEYNYDVTQRYYSNALWSDDISSYICYLEGGNIDDGYV